MPVKYSSVEVTVNDVEKIGIKIMEGEFENLVFTVDKIRFADKENDDGTIDMSFNYDIIEGEEKVDTEEKKDLLSPVIGDIIFHILENSTVKDDGGVEYNEPTDEQE